MKPKDLKRAARPRGLTAGVFVEYYQSTNEPCYSSDPDFDFDWNWDLYINALNY